MFITKKHRLEVYSSIFSEGVLIVKKEVYKAKHDYLEVPNLVVMNLMKSFKSKGYVRETYNWRYFYYYLTDSGVNHLREVLHLPSVTVPETHKERPEEQHFAPRPTGRGKQVGAPSDFKPEYNKEGGESGYRRGAPRGRGFKTA